MQGTKISLLLGGVLLAAVGRFALAEELQPDPAWQQGRLDNGFNWQLLTTPQRPNDRLELRLVVNTGSLSENTQQTGFSHVIPRLAMMPNASFTPGQLAALWASAPNDETPSPVVVSYDFTSYNLSLPNNRPELLKDALSWLAETAGGLSIDDHSMGTVLQRGDGVATLPPNPQDPAWRYRLQDSILLARNPGQPVKTPLTAEALQTFYKAWYTPDAMTLYVVGNVDHRAIVDQIRKVFAPLEGKRATPAPMPVLSPLPSEPIRLIGTTGKPDSIALIWDTVWQPIRDSNALARYWQRDLAREAMFQRVQQALEKSALKEANVRFDCNVLYGRAQCSLHMDNLNGEQLVEGVTLVGKALGVLQESGLTQAEFDALVARKNEELGKLFATYARTGTQILMEQRLRSQRSGVVDIAPEQYQQLRKNYLSSVTLESLNRALRLQLAQPATLLLQQQPGEPEANLKELMDRYNGMMTQAESAAPAADETAPAAP
ncbi:M16 family metallopeptidase [Lonsdalea populi]|uniref:M16 family metallopeptidase n=1 Tax=Lonsdalea populi TaxID=1172565 RepID=UPI000A2611CF|nr:pitrilysin family protein [Lonsdalea populi]OSM95221.1 peptidase [Lonsdalea populi]RAT66731.1 peptidase [Lonsdalea populi]RAT74625.1 peptidase [Lonsdalea populi]RAT76804.1 peptidase [Lonsdalea populi]RAT77821.1 peptidase [Lonsdalea populi]